MVFCHKGNSGNSFFSIKITLEAKSMRLTKASDLILPFYCMRTFLCYLKSDDNDDNVAANMNSDKYDVA